MSCTTKENFLNHRQLSELKGEFIHANWQPYPLGEGIEMLVCALPLEIEEQILAGVEEMLGKQLNILHMYGRFNSPDHDTSFRIHSDGSIGSVEPDYASVLYLTTGSSCTAFWEHPEHGREGKGLVFTEDDGQWNMTGYCDEEENTCVVYDANRFHSRYPPQVEQPRFVVVGFYAEKN